ncbi:MAG: chemotaxis protein CheW [Ramlibacter sp.]
MTSIALSPSTPPRAAPAGTYGGFRLGELQLAVPMSALREIVPCDTLVPLRGMADCIAGGLQRGKAVVPVVDLRSALGQPLGSALAANVLVVTHEGELLGLLAHDVTGILTGAAVMAEPATAAARHASPLVNGHLPLGDGRNLRILSLAAVAALPRIRTQRKPVARTRALPAWLGALAGFWRRRGGTPAWRLSSAQMSGMWDTVAPGIRG